MHAISRAAVLVALFAALPGPALAQDISGTWKAAIELDAGSGEPTFVFEQEGELTTDSYTGTFGGADLTRHRHGRHDRVLFRRTDGRYGHLHRDDQRRHNEGHLRLRTARLGHVGGGAGRVV